jgi:predicted XRE-type DNA-binding protein
MNWLDIAYGFLFFSNLVFMAGSGYLLLRLLKTTAQSRVDLLKAAGLTVEAGKHLKLAANRTVTELERVSQAHQVRENVSARAISALSFKVQNLIDNLGQLGAPSVATEADQGAEAQNMVEDVRAKLQAELNTALSKNHMFQEQIEEVQFYLKEASSSNERLRAEIGELQGIKQSEVDSLMQQTAKLEDELQKAQERAKEAERVAEQHALQLDEIRAQINAQDLPTKLSNADAAQASGRPVDQADLIQDQQGQIDLLAEREKSLLAKIEQMEMAFQRQKTEKAFIEERFLQLDSAQLTPPNQPDPDAPSSPP